MLAVIVHNIALACLHFRFVSHAILRVVAVGNGEYRHLSVWSTGIANVRLPQLELSSAGVPAHGLESWFLNLQGTGGIALLVVRSFRMQHC